ncbi:MAG: TatD family hydrolase [Desulfobacterales bacterium]|nr:TatD family hydrolase [Desulfobacterales bacterium]
MLIDTHCHLNDSSFDERLPEVIHRAKKHELCAIIVPAYDLESLSRTHRVCDHYPDFLFPVYGIHPWYVQPNINWNDLVFFINQPHTKAIGEIGLDHSEGCPSHDLQREALMIQLEYATTYNLPVIIHCRKAYEPLYEILKTYKGSIEGVIHSFSSSKEMMFKFIELGYYISFSGSVTRSKARKYHMNAKHIPLERMLLETDSPCIATESTVASQVEPRHSGEIAQMISQLRNLPYEHICDITTQNAKHLFRIHN